MKAVLKRTVSMLLAMAMVLSLCVAGITPHVHAAGTSIKSANVAQGKSVTFAYGSQVTNDSNWGVSIINSGLTALTDGENDSPNWWVNNGNPYIGLKSSVVTGPYSFTVDLGGNYITEQISVYSYSRTDWGVDTPDAVTFSVSINGSAWTEMGTVNKASAQTTIVDDSRNPNDQKPTIYQFSLPVDSADARYVKVSFGTNSRGLIGIGEIEVYGVKAPSLISQGASITYFGHGTEIGDDANWGSAAVNSGLSVLTDGVGNSPNWWVNNGNPNIGLKNSVLPGEYVFNMNIGAPSSVSRISTYFYSRTDWGVDAPNAVTYSVSSDGIIWKQVGSVDKASATVTTLVDDRNPNDQAPTIYTFTLKFDAMDAQYVKVTFGSNSLGVVGLQEIQAYGVKKTITNLALGRLANSNYYTYEVTGGGTGYESTGTTKPGGGRYTINEVENASISRLTDGTIINASAVNYNGWTSQKWNSSGTIMSKYLQIYRNDSRIITMDLGAVRNVTGIRMHFAAVESMGFYMPTNVTYYLSENGVDYYEVSDVWNYQATADPNDKNISGSGPRHEWYSASGINFNARYVKVIFPVNVYILSDELQVYGSEVLSANPTALESCPKYDPLEKYVGHFADQAQTGGVRNEFMAYSGWYVNSDGGDVYNTYKTVKEYMTSIAYVNSNGVPQDWLFDDVTVMGHYYTSRGTFNSYKAGYTSGKYYANQNDWYEWLCYAFGKSTTGKDLSYDGESIINLEALEEAARIAKETLNDPDYKVGVKLVLFPAVEYQENWGTINGKKIDFTISGAGSQEAALANRKAAYQWYVDQAVAMWEQAGFEHLELTGFYYYEETIHESTDRIAKAATQELTKIVHEHATPSTNTKPSFDSRVGGHLYIYQLPFYQSEGYWNWAEYGFDYALMQPNYSFYDMYTLTQLKECADLCTYYGLGMQMEFGGTASTTYHQKFKDYLDYGPKYGYQSSVVSWYMSTWGCYSMAYNNNGTRYLYDMVYEFVKGQTIPTCEHPEHNINGRCLVCAAEVEHSFVVGECVCGATCAVDYYLFGWINGANYACEEDYENLGVYKFVDGKLTAGFAEDSYVAVKSDDNLGWFMTDGWQGFDTTSVTLYNSSKLGESADKLYVPGGHIIEFTLVKNEDGTYTLSYTATICEHESHNMDGLCTICGQNVGHSYEDGVCAGCGLTCVHSWTDGVCDICGFNCGHDWNNGICDICGLVCDHDWIDGGCSICGSTCDHNWNEGTCPDCGAVCGHSWTEGVCDVCGLVCGHEWDDGTCTVCGTVCVHSWIDGVCDTCGKACEHIYWEGSCTICGFACSHVWDGNVCSLCAMPCGHEYVDGVCTICGTIKEYYLFGYINGANYGCEEDYATIGEYKFVEGTLIATFDQISYVAIKTSDNTYWYMTDGWQGEVTSATLYDTTTLGENADKLYVPGGERITFTLVENADGTLTLSYEICKHESHDTDGTCTNCGENVEHRYILGICDCGLVCEHPAYDAEHVCTTCGMPCTHDYQDGICVNCGALCDHSWVEGACEICGVACEHTYSNDGICTTCGMTCVHSWVEGICEICGAADPDYVVSADYFLVGSMNEWTASDEYKLIENDGVYTLTTVLTAGEYTFKVEDSNGNWYPDGTDNGLVINVAFDSEVTFTFDPTTGETTAAVSILRNDSPDIKWQVTAGTNADSATTNLRFLTWVDNLQNYSAVTFHVTLNGKTIDLECTTVYTAILASGVAIRNPANVFKNPDAQYFATYTLKNIPNSAFDTPIVVSVTWTDLQGNETTSDYETIIIADDWA